MISTAHETKTEIERIIRAAFAAAAAMGELPDAAPADFTVEVPADTMPPHTRPPTVFRFCFSRRTNLAEFVLTKAAYRAKLF